MLLAALVIGARVVGRLRYSRGTPEQKLLMDVAAIRRSIKKSSEGFADRGLMSDYIDRAPEEIREAAEPIRACPHGSGKGSSRNACPRRSR